MFSDAKGVLAIFKDSVRNSTLRRYAMALQELPLVMTPIASTRNPADPLTRPPFVKTDAALLPLQELASPLALHPGWKAVRALLPEDVPTLSESSGRVASATVASLSALPNTEAELITALDADEQLVAIRDFISRGRPSVPANADASTISRHRQLTAASSELVVSPSGLLLHAAVVDATPVFRTVIPSGLRDGLLAAAHEHGPLIHGGKHGLAMYNELSRFAWWASMRADCLRYECATCARNKKSHLAPAGLLHPITAAHPGERISLDFIPMPKAHGFTGFFLLVDKFSGFSLARPSIAATVVSATAAVDDVRNLLVNIAYVHCDGAFAGVSFCDAMKSRGIEVSTSFPYHQQANFVERSVQTVKQILRTSLEGVPTKLWPVVLLDIIAYLNMTDQSSRDSSPVAILQGVPPPNLLPFINSEQIQSLEHLFSTREQLREHVRRHHDRAIESQRQHYDASHRNVRFAVGDVVLVRQHRQEEEDGNYNLSPPYDPNPWIVAHVLSEVSYIVCSWEKRDQFRAVHVSDLKRAQLEREDPRVSLAVEDVPEYVIQKIHGHHTRNGIREYQVEWGGYRATRDWTWEPEDSLQLHAACADITLYQLRQFRYLLGIRVF